MFLHLREKTKFIRYDRCNHSILTKRRKKDAPSVVVFSRRRLSRFPRFPILPIFRKIANRSPRRPDDSTNFTDCSNFSQRKGRERSITQLSGVASKKSRPNSTCAAPTRFAPLVRTFRLRTLFANARRRSRPRVFRRTLAKLSPNFVNFAFSSRVFRFSFKGESNGGA